MVLHSPKLMAVGRSERLHYKVSVDGALLLKTGRFMKRYTGNPHIAIDINAKVWLNPGKLLKEIQAGKKVGKPKKKKSPVETGEVNAFTCITEQISDNLSTQPKDLRTDINELSTQPKKKNTVNKKEVQRRIMAMLNSQYGHRELYFITVSFPPCVTDANGIKSLNTWLTSLRKYRMLHQYLWVAERQPDTNTIHFHIAVPHYFPVQKANAMMRGTLRNMHKTGEINYPGNAKYNGVDIAGRRMGPGQKTKKHVTNFAEKKGGKALGWYLTKYVTKNNAEFENLAWHNSRGYSSLFHGITLSYEEFEDRLSYVDRLDNSRIFENEWFAWCPWAGGPPVEVKRHLFEVNSYMQSLLEIIHPKDVGVLAYIETDYKTEQTCYYNTIKSYNEMKEPYVPDFFWEETILNQLNALDYPGITADCVCITDWRVDFFEKIAVEMGCCCVVLHSKIKFKDSYYSIVEISGEGKDKVIAFDFPGGESYRHDASINTLFYNAPE